LRKRLLFKKEKTNKISKDFVFISAILFSCR
jgi:hypothetical protein